MHLDQVCCQLALCVCQVLCFVQHCDVAAGQPEAEFAAGQFVGPSQVSEVFGAHLGGGEAGLQVQAAIAVGRDGSGCDVSVVDQVIDDGQWQVAQELLLGFGCDVAVLGEPRVVGVALPCCIGFVVLVVWGAAVPGGLVGAVASKEGAGACGVAWREECFQPGSCLEEGLDRGERRQWQYGGDDVLGQLVRGGIRGLGFKVWRGIARRPVLQRLPRGPPVVPPARPSLM